MSRRYGRRSYGRRGRYRGGGGGKVILLVILAVLVFVGLWLSWNLIFPPEPEPTPTPVVTPPPTPEPTPTPTPMRAKPEAVRGLYVSGPVAGDPYMNTIIQLVDDTELNAVVIDVKNDEGKVTFRSENATAQEIGACVRYIGDLPGLLAKLKEHDIYAIARISAFKDPVLAKGKPELTLRKSDGTPVAESGSLAWVNPFEPEVWDYLTELALEAAAAGFDEVQFDYVRFPSGTGTGNLDLGPHAEDKTRVDAIKGFLEHVRAALKPEGVWLSADVFGVVITNKGDGEFLGQDYLRLVEAVDFISPMIYPSHYSSGYFNLKVPDAEPYACILGALTRSMEVLTDAPEDSAVVRPWLQAFTATWVKGHIKYGGDQIREQIQAVYDAGYTEWLLWNAQNSYSSAGLLPAEGAEAGE